MILSSSMWRISCVLVVCCGNKNQPDTPLKRNPFKHQIRL
jgi:hypothetical protein